MLSLTFAAMNESAAAYLPILMQLGLAAGFVGATLFVTHFLGPRRKTHDKLENFECGLEVIGDARAPISVKYFMTAILFVLFDVEVIFMYPWATNFKVLGTEGFWQMMVFVAFLLFGFIYLIRKRALDWEK